LRVSDDSNVGPGALATSPTVLRPEFGWSVYRCIPLHQDTHASDQAACRL